jgi:hypothetical protein
MRRAPAGQRADEALSARGWLDRAARVAGNAASVLEREETDHADVSASGRPQRWTLDVRASKI